MGDIDPALTERLRAHIGEHETVANTVVVDLDDFDLRALCDAADERDALRTRAETAERERDEARLDARGSHALHRAADESVRMAVSALTAQSAVVEALRGALVRLRDGTDAPDLVYTAAEYGWDSAAERFVEWAKNEVDAALSLTPPVALAEHDARVLERIANDAEASITDNPPLLLCGGDHLVGRHEVLREIASDLRAEATRLRAEGGGNDE